MARLAAPVTNILGKGPPLPPLLAVSRLMATTITIVANLFIAAAPLMLLGATQIADGLALRWTVA